MSEYEYEPDAADSSPSDADASDEAWGDQAGAALDPIEVPAAGGMYDGAVLGPQGECEICGALWGNHSRGCPYADG